MVEEFDPSPLRLADPPPQVFIECDALGRYVIYRRLEPPVPEAATPDPEPATNWLDLEPEAREWVESRAGGPGGPGVQYSCPGQLAAKAKWPSGNLGIA